MKVVELQCFDGEGLFAYAGLGATRIGIQPSAWLHASLRGSGRVPFEQVLQIMTEVAARELPRHLAGMRPPRQHNIIVLAHLDKTGPRLYTIDVVLDRRHRASGACKDLRRWDDSRAPAVSLYLGGTGGAFLKNLSTGWYRALLNRIGAFDEGRLSGPAVADYLAHLNSQASAAVDTVGPRSLVVWRRRGGGGAQQFYEGIQRCEGGPILPSIMNGNDMTAIAEIMLREYTKAIGLGGELLDADEGAIKRQMAELPTSPDWNLR